MGGDSKRERKEKRKNETPEERSQRKLEKRLRKEEKKKKEEKELYGYTNDENPFGDSNLTTKFVWRLKNEKQQSNNNNSNSEGEESNKKISKKEEKEKQKQIRLEIEKAKQRRVERETEKRLWQEERDRMAREQDLSALEDWEKTEEDFERKQAQARSRIRLREGRAKPIDILSKNLTLLYSREHAAAASSSSSSTIENVLAAPRITHEDDEYDPEKIIASGDFDIEMREPYKIFEGLALKELEDLRKDIHANQELEFQREFWDALMVVCEDEIAHAKKLEDIRRRNFEAKKAGRREEGVHDAVRMDVIKVLTGKSAAELEDMQKRATDLINQSATGSSSVIVDVDYWTTVLRQISVFKAKATLREFHTRLLKLHLDYLEQKRIKEEQQLRLVKREEGQETEEETTTTTTTTTTTENQESAEDRAKRISEAIARLQSTKDESQLAKARELAKSKIEAATAAAAASSSQDLSGASEEELRMRRHYESQERARQEANKSAQDQLIDDPDFEFGDAEDIFKDEFDLPTQSYAWNDRYRPRKPRFFNRVHIGYEWNKYNQTHYDSDNPPPKVVKGYKFNVFYPDLIDKTKAPTYHIEKNGNDEDTVILRFHAGPPYEDIAFKIVNKEWEFSTRRGFKSTFDKGILSLHFFFRRYRYRR